MRTTRLTKPANKMGSIKNTMKFQFEDDNCDRTTSPTVTIKDLCQEDKAKIGDLIKRLAEEQEEKKKLQEQIKLKEDECKRKVQKYKLLSDSAKKEQKQTEEKFKESLEVIRKLQQQEQLIHEQMLQARVNKYDSFTQYEIENKENKVQQPPLPPPPKQQKSEIMLLKAEIEEITNSLKQIQFEQVGQEEKRIEISPIRGIRKFSQVDKPQSQYDRQFYDQQQQSQVPQSQYNRQFYDQQQQQQQNYHERPHQIEKQLFPDKPKHVSTQQTDKSQDKSLKYQVEKKPPKEKPQSKPKTLQNSEVQTINQHSADKQIQTETNSAINSHTSNFYPEPKNQSTIRFYDEFKALESKLKQNQNQYHITKEVSMQSDSFQQQKIESSSDDDEEINIAQELLKRKNQRISQQYQIRNSINTQQTQQQGENTNSQRYSQRFTQPQNTTNLLQSNQFKTNTLSFNLTNQECTPQQSVQKSAEQFGSSMLQTPQQRELHSQQLHFSNQEEEIDSVITSLNGRSFNKPNILQQEIKQESDSSESSIPREEYQKLIDRYMKENDSDDD